jgi:hypothetical protein
MCFVSYNEFKYYSFNNKKSNNIMDCSKDNYNQQSTIIRPINSKSFKKKSNTLKVIKLKNNGPIDKNEFNILNDSFKSMNLFKNNKNINNNENIYNNQNKIILDNIENDLDEKEYSNSSKIDDIDTLTDNMTSMVVSNINNQNDNNNNQNNIDILDNNQNNNFKIINALDEIISKYEKENFVDLVYYDVNSEHEINPLNILIPTEIVNTQCKYYFDDEDFVYIKFRLPKIINKQIENHGCDNLFEYFEYIISEDIDTYNSDLYFNILCIFEDVIKFYDDEQDDPDMNIKLSYNNLSPLKVLEVIDLMTEQSNDDCNYDKIYTYLNTYNNEVLLGVGIINHQIMLITNYYKSQGIINIEFYQEHHRNRYVKLVNNLCVIMLFLKFYYSIGLDNYDYEADIEDNLDLDDDDKIILPKIPTNLRMTKSKLTNNYY